MARGWRSGYDRILSSNQDETDEVRFRREKSISFDSALAKSSDAALRMTKLIAMAEPVSIKLVAMAKQIAMTNVIADSVGVPQIKKPRRLNRGFRDKS
jgi:hypothetical protein